MSTPAAPQLKGSHSLAIEWALPSQSLKVQLSAGILSSLQMRVRESLRTEPELRPAGVLIGRCACSATWNVSIEEYLPIEWDASRGGAPFLTDEQQSRVDGISAVHRTDALLVGFYRIGHVANDDERSATETPDDVLGEDERAFIAKYCSVSNISIAISLETENLEPR
ncbi:MAG: hypothetical protein JOZ62_11285, partial [Acidobacteriaceae bacterium]|nr:hypothetical protein [Acidobacteriaceae bacterium]